MSAPSPGSPVATPRPARRSPRVVRGRSSRMSCLRTHPATSRALVLFCMLSKQRPTISVQSRDTHTARAASRSALRVMSVWWDTSCSVVRTWAGCARRTLPVRVSWRVRSNSSSRPVTGVSGSACAYLSPRSSRASAAIIASEMAVWASGCDSPTLFMSSPSEDPLSPRTWARLCVLISITGGRASLMRSIS